MRTPFEARPASPAAAATPAASVQALAVQHLRDRRRTAAVWVYITIVGSYAADTAVVAVYSALGVVDPAAWWQFGLASLILLLFFYGWMRHGDAGGTWRIQP